MTAIPACFLKVCNFQLTLTGAAVGRPCCVQGYHDIGRRSLAQARATWRAATSSWRCAGVLGDRAPLSASNGDAGADTQVKERWEAEYRKMEAARDRGPIVNGRSAVQVSLSGGRYRWRLGDGGGTAPRERRGARAPGSCGVALVYHA